MVAFGDGLVIPLLYSSGICLPEAGGGGPLVLHKPTTSGEPATLQHDQGTLK
jgi:hypothetical protein